MSAPIEVLLARLAVTLESARLSVAHPEMFVDVTAIIEQAQRELKQIQEAL